ncbi:MAG: FkbM family methyltransferase [Pseudomonadota bacterium]
MLSAVIDPPFGTHALPGWLERLRRWGQHIGRSGMARRVASLIRRVCMLGRDDPFDVEPFPGQRARLYPRDNLSEKRVFGATQFWDHAERDALQVAAKRATPPFHFVDAGANVGLYTLAVRSFGAMRGLAIEPDDENLRRLRINLAASRADEVTVAAFALADKAGEAVLSKTGANRGEIALGGQDSDGVTIQTRPLRDLVEDAGFQRIDALKIDIEGAEEPVLTAFYRDARRALWPRLVLIEARRGEETPALDLLHQHGYRIHERTRMNAIMALKEEAEQS